MVPPRCSTGGCIRSGAVGETGIGVSEAREARRLALTRPAVPLNIAARSFLLLLYTSSVFGRKIEARMVAARVPHPDDAVLPPDGSWAVSR